jgi:UDP-glucuronate 4-epimerase
VNEILVTGGAGFIGSHLCEALLEDGRRVVCLDNMDNYYSPRRKVANLRGLMGREAFTFIRGDIRDRDFIDSVLAERQIDAIVHLAARAGVRASIEDPQLYTDVNLNGTMILLEASRNYGIRRFVFASSSSVYGRVEENQPFHEGRDADHPESPYGATKRGGELLAYAHHRIWGLPVAVLRLFTVYGPRQRPEMAIHMFTRRIDEGEKIPLFGDGSSLRDYTYVDDIVQGIRGALLDDRGFEIYNLGNSNPVRLLDMVHCIEEALGKKARIEWLPDQPGDVPMTYADIRKAKSHLGFSPKVGIEEGIRRFVEWYVRTDKVTLQPVESTGDSSC